MPRVFIVAMSLPFPPAGGSELRNWHNVLAFLRRGTVGVYGLRGGVAAEPPHPGIAIWRTPSHVVGVPEEVLGWLGVADELPVDHYVTDAVVRELRDLIVEFRPDLVVLADLGVTGVLPALAGVGCPVVLDVHNVESRLHEQLAAGSGSDRAAALVRRRLAERWAKREASGYAAVDGVWTCSDADAAAVRTRTATPVHVVPNTVDVDSYEFVPKRSGAPVMVFPAMFGFPPNEQAGEFLLREVLPEVARVFPAARLILAGRAMSDDLRTAATDDARVEVTGAVADIRPVLTRSTVMPVPLFAASGTRLKILEAAAAGVPVVSTATGAEGLELEEGRHWLRAEDARGFVNTVIALCSDERVGRELASAARVRVVERYSLDAGARAVDHVWRTLGLAEPR